MRQNLSLCGCRYNYRQILENPLMSEAVPSESIHRRLKYLSLKNSAELLELEGTDLRQALDSYSAATGRALLWDVERVGLMDEVGCRERDGQEVGTYGDSDRRCADAPLLPCFCLRAQSWTRAT